MKGRGYYNKLDSEALEKLKQAGDLKASYQERLEGIEKRLKKKRHVLLKRQKKQLINFCKKLKSRLKN